MSCNKIEGGGERMGCALIAHPFFVSEKSKPVRCFGTIEKRRYELFNGNHESSGDDPEQEGC